MTPLLSIIIPNWNNGHLLGWTLDSVLSQTYSNWECLIVDDLSEDNSKEIALGYTEQSSKIQYIERNRGPKGASTCRNIGASRAKGEYLIFLDSDDLLAAHCLETRLKSAREHPNHDFYVFPLDSFSTDPSIRRQYYKDFNNELYEIDPFLLYLSSRGPFQTTCFMWRSAFMKKIGGFNEAFPRAQDAEISLRAFYEGCYKMFLDVPPDCHYRNDPNSNRKARDRHTKQQKKQAQLKGLKLYATTSYEYTRKAIQDHPENESTYREMFRLQATSAKGYFIQNNYWLSGYFEFLLHLHRSRGISLSSMTRLLGAFISSKGFFRAKLRTFGKLNS